ncbi:ABC transporter substrate-binding protein [Cohnella zeiphila]|uniref:Extracellular solute-binding protein n=1 Tax=Cohnella zeiphila TaxID=2761120 RepID=A0A7X0VTL1_9BACL|nr:extracellular solute-binding protein [Cohnella zeiphila]MBB6729475.1 extracellular solute-binding protein [Cohnella zeiphila]
MMKSVIGDAAKLLLAGGALLVAAGCSGQAGSEAASSMPGGGQADEITLAFQDSARTKDVEDLIAKFNASHPGVQVETLALPSDRYDESLNMLMTSGEGPDVFEIGTGWLTSYIYKNWLLDLSEAAPDDVRGEFPAWAADYTKKNDHYYAIPSAMMTVRLIYNKKLLASAGCDPDRPPATLEELKSCADRISEAGTGYNRYGFALPANDDEAGFRLPLEMAGTYGGVYDYDYTLGKYDFSAYLPWFQAMLDMKREGGLFPGEISLKFDTALTQFAQGNVGMMIVSSRDFAALERMLPASFEWGAAMPPSFDAASKGKGALMIEPEPPFAVNAYTAHKEEAIDLWQYLLSDDYLGELYEKGELIPARPEVTEDSRYRPSLPSMREFLPASEESIYPKEPKFILKYEPTQFIQGNVGDSVRMKAYRDILQGLRSPEEALKELTEQYNRSIENAIYQKLINMNDYVFPDFDPLLPLAAKNLSQADSVENGVLP